MRFPSFSAKLEALFPAFVMFWLVGVSALSLRLLRDLLLVERLARTNRSRHLDSLRYITASLALRMGMTRIPLLLESARVEVPTVIGWLRAAILIPPSALAGLSPQAVEALLAHELAHIRRHDYLFNLLQAVLETLLFYHPAAWWVAQRIRIEREYCCDDIAVRTLGNQVLYANALASLESLRAAPPVPALAVTGGGLLVRVRRLLGLPHVNPHPLPRSGGVLLALCALLGPATVAQYAPPRSTRPVETTSIRPEKHEVSVKSAPSLARKHIVSAVSTSPAKKRERTIRNVSSSIGPSEKVRPEGEACPDAIPVPDPVPESPYPPEMPVISGERSQDGSQQDNIAPDRVVNINNGKNEINIRQVKNINNAMMITPTDKGIRISKPVLAADWNIKPQTHPIALPEGMSADIDRNVKKGLREGFDQWMREVERGLHEMERSLNQVEEDIKQAKRQAEQEKHQREQERRQEEQDWGRREQKKHETNKIKVDFLKRPGEECDEIRGRKEWMKPRPKDFGFRFG